MVYALDATPLTESTGGVRRYTHALTAALAHSFPDDRIFLLSDQPVPASSSQDVSSLPPNVRVQCGAAGPIERRWWLLGLAKRLKQLGCELFHGTDFSVPYLSPTSSVLSIHDCSPWMDPAWHSGADRVRKRTPWLLRLRIPSLVITPTAAIQRQVASTFGFPSDRIACVPYAPSLHSNHVQTPDREKPYILFVGTVEPRKNLPVLVEAWRHVRASYDVDLVVAGRHRADAPPIPREPGLFLAGAVSDAEMVSLYAGAIACVYPSLYEGFGLPPVEAMSCGCPVIVSKDPALVEVTGNAAIHVDAHDTHGLAMAIEALVCNRAERERLSALGRVRASGFTWEKTAALTREVYVEAIRRRKG